MKLPNDATAAHYLSVFTHAYINAIIELAEPEDEEEFELYKFSPHTLERIHEDCAQFIKLSSEYLANVHKNVPGYSAANAGNDFWLTRNGHGAGFWDRDLGDDGDLLTDIADSFPAIDAYMGDDGKVYLA